MGICGAARNNCANVSNPELSGRNRSTNTATTAPAAFRGGAAAAAHAAFALLRLVRRSMPSARLLTQLTLKGPSLLLISASRTVAASGASEISRML
jgi:hypothetical protein